MKIVGGILILIRLIKNITGEEVKETPNVRKTEGCHFDKAVGKVVECSGLNMTNIPTFPKFTVEIYLSNNEIWEIKDYTFVYNERLRVLDLSQNKIRQLTSRSFAGLGHLETLNLEGNTLNGACDKLSKTCFQYLKRLKYLNIKNNPIKLFPGLTSLKSLETLRMDFTYENHMLLSSKLKVLRNLVYLDLSGPKSCKPKVLEPATFHGMTTIKHLDLSYNSLKEIWIGTFSQMKHLEYLDISHNTRLGFNVISNVTYDLSSTSIKIFKFKQIVYPFSMNQMVKMEHLRSLKNTSLQELYADSNRLQLVELGAVSFLPKTLRKISIGDNELSYGYYIFELSKLSVQVINTSFLSYTHDPTESDSGLCISTNNFKIRQKNLSEKFEIFRYVESVPPLKLDFFQKIRLPKNLRKLYYRNCKLQIEIPKLNFYKNVLEVVDLSSNVFYSLRGPILNLVYLKFLDLSNNFCSNISQEFFSGTPNIKVLFLQNNLLGFILPSDEDGRIFKHLSKLENISLAENKISSLPSKIFGSHSEMKEINLKGNLLERMHLKLNHMKKLSFLDLSNNVIQYLKAEEIKELESINESGNLTVDLSGNPLQCKCQSIHFIKWMFTTKIRLKNLHSYHCQLANLSRRAIKSPTEIYETLKKECSSYFELILAVAALLVIVIIITFAGVAYRYRWKLRYLYFMTKFKYRKTYDVMPNQLHYDYDAFVSYADEDQQFVHNMFLTKIETECRLNVCLHKRDFIVGNEIAANITDAIRRSHKIVCIISNSFLNSYWCMFEFNMARMESIYSRQGENILYLIFLESISAQNLPLVLLELVQAQSYLEFPNDEFGDAVFWENLKHVLSD